jgi:flagellar biogenesis protein FliO
MNRANRIWLGMLFLLLGFHPSAWGQVEPGPPSNRGQAIRVLTPSSVVQPNSNATPSPTGVAIPTQLDKPIPIKSSSDLQSSRIAPPRSPWSSMLSTAASLLVVVFLFLGAVLVLRKSQPKQFQKLPKDVVEVLGRTPIAPRQNLVVVRFGSKLILVSQQPGETRALSEIEDANETVRLTGLCESSRPESISNSFREVLQQVVQAKPSASNKGSRAA